MGIAMSFLSEPEAAAAWSSSLVGMGRGMRREGERKIKAAAWWVGRSNSKWQGKKAVAW